MNGRFKLLNRCTLCDANGPTSANRERQDFICNENQFTPRYYLTGTIKALDMERSTVWTTDSTEWKGLKLQSRRSRKAALGREIAHLIPDQSFLITADCRTEIKRLNYSLQGKLKHESACQTPILEQAKRCI